MSLDDEQLESMIRQRLEKEMRQIQVPSVDQAWSKFKDFAVKQQNRRRRVAAKAAVASVMLIVALSTSLTLFRPVQAYAFGEGIMQILNHLVGATTKDKTETIGNGAGNAGPPVVKNLGSDVERQVTLDEARKLVPFEIAEPAYLPVGMAPAKISLTNIGKGVYKLRMEYVFRGKTLIFSQQNTSAGVSQGLLYDTDDTKTENIRVNGTQASFSTDKSGVNVLTWHLRGLLLKMTGELPKDTFLAIAKSIQ
ncbi:hypothetical protein CEB3_c28630 [Peptococcaceae bacterium CEB3]|nr:hypothetical protein CEB3_c28630 [Peptococcaceae bacterium CEB3]